MSPHNQYMLYEIYATNLAQYLVFSLFSFLLLTNTHLYPTSLTPSGIEALIQKLDILKMSSTLPQLLLSTTTNLFSFHIFQQILA